MSAPTTTTAARRDQAPGRKAGYVIAVAINAVLLWVSHQLLEWGWPRFLTDDYEQLLGIITASFVATMIANALFVLADPPWFKALANTVTSFISFVVAWRTWQVFPFDFDGYARDWSTLVRVILVVGMVGTAIATVVNLLLVPVRLGQRRRGA
jgi:membrane protease YdiL (CAAX protease family)